MEKFLKKYNIPLEDFEKTGLVWDGLMTIKEDFNTYRLELEPPAKYLIERFHKANNVHSVRYRIKDSEHLIAKIIRKKISEPTREITIENYKTELTDLIGLRILHLFKDDWIQIHNFITNSWELHEKPIAYHREGDSSEYINHFKKNDCDVKVHPFGYRSVHYLLKTQPSKELYVAEIQVRTIFEEAWSEIDHSVRYPYDMDNKLLSQFLVILNRLAGSSDEMGSYVKYLKRELSEREAKHQKLVEEKNDIIDELRSKISKLEIEPKEVLSFETALDKMRTLSETDNFQFNFKLPEMPDFELPSLENIDFKFEVPSFEEPSFPSDTQSKKPLMKGKSGSGILRKKK